MFLDNRYTDLYFKIINSDHSSDQGGYCETHHIIPRSLGGSDDIDNLVRFSARKHFICHMLLPKMVAKNSDDYHKMLSAAIMMGFNPNGGTDRYMNSRLFDYQRSEYSRVLSGRMLGCGNTQHGTMWIHSNELRSCKKINSSEPLPDGWLKGRRSSFDYLDRCCNDCGINLNLTKNCKSVRCSECVLKLRRSRDTIRHAALKDVAIEMYNEWISGDYTGITNYAYSSNCGFSPNTLKKLWMIHISNPILRKK